MDKPNKPIGRRGVLAMLGSAPFVAKQTATAATDVSVVGRRAPQFRSYASNRSKVRQKILQLLANGEAIPAYKHREWLDEAKCAARILDPDIASMHSVSLSRKIGLQTERNYERQVSSFIDDAVINDAWGVFKKALGITKNDAAPWDDED